MNDREFTITSEITTGIPVSSNEWLLEIAISMNDRFFVFDPSIIISIDDFGMFAFDWS